MGTVSVGRGVSLRFKVGLETEVEAGGDGNVNARCCFVVSNVVGTLLTVLSRDVLGSMNIGAGSLKDVDENDDPASISSSSKTSSSMIGVLGIIGDSQDEHLDSRR